MMRYKIKDYIDIPAVGFVNQFVQFICISEPGVDRRKGDGPVAVIS